MENLLEVSNLRTYFHTAEGIIHAVDDVSLNVGRGEIVGVVGESGSGKSVMALSIMRLIEEPGRIVSGEVRFNGRNLLALSEREMSRLRGNRMAMIFQHPQSSFNPVVPVGRQVAETLEIHRAVRRGQSIKQAIELLQQVSIPDPERTATQYPHELSGGTAQRAMIAMALACRPDLLIADEPTSALDATVQMQILDLLGDLRRRLGVAILLITHDLGIIAGMADRVVVLYAGRIQEEASTRDLFIQPMHPYTAGLLGAIPQPGQPRGMLAVIPGTPALPVHLPPGCRFASRCAARERHRLSICTQAEPDLAQVGENRRVRCWLSYPEYGFHGAASSELLGRQETT